VGTIIQGLITLNQPDYAFQRWHGTLLTIAVVAFCVAIHAFAARRLPVIEGSLAVLHFGGLIAVIAVLWAMAPRNNAHDAFLKLTNNGGWSSDGLSMLVGLYPLTLCLLGFDSQVHMSEEISSAARGLPRSIMWSTYANAFLGFIMVITLIFTWGDADDIAASPTGYPFLQVFYNTTRSLAGTDVMSLLIILPLTGSVIACVATASRQIWVRRHAKNCWSLEFRLLAAGLCKRRWGAMVQLHSQGKVSVGSRCAVQLTEDRFTRG
jgi:amino acid transporter